MTSGVFMSSINTQPGNSVLEFGNFVLVSAYSETRPAQKHNDYVLNNMVIQIIAWKYRPNDSEVCANKAKLNSVGLH